MPAQLTLNLSEDEREQLEQMRDYAQKPYLRERAAALLKIADGIPGYKVAKERLLKDRKPDTIYAWYHRYVDEGIEGLKIRDGRGRKPAFSP